LYYGDEVQISEEGNVPYGWQFKDENISIKTAKGKRLNCFGMITRDNKFEFTTTYEIIDTQFIIEKINQFSYEIKRHTVIVLDNAKVHQSKFFKSMRDVWAKRNLFIFYLPPYSPQLNIIERVWKEMKARWINEKDYQSADNLFYATHLVLNDIGKSLKMNFKKI
jgi:transposase